ncbi:MAG: AAA family ATPase, partial [Actinomycetota bacterium]|nr:AAA family ATPase [Actinomycetota bacterium]
MTDQFSEGTVTLLFTDIQGSTDLGTNAGDHVARRILRAHDEVVQSRVTEHGGREIKSLGDGFMVAFTSARRALACAIDIQQSLETARDTSPDDFVEVRIGLNAGEVIHEGDDLFGSAVGAAARITAHAEGRQIIISEVVKALVGSVPDVRFRDLGPTELKGFEEPWRLFEVEWARKTTGPSKSRKTAFVGREKERAELSRALDELKSGTGGLVLIGGEPGVGKTRLAEETAAEAVRRDFRTLIGRCYDVDAPPPYLPFIEVLEGASREVDLETFRMALGNAAGEIAKVMPQLRNLYDDIPPGLDLPPEQERRYLFNSIVEFVGRAASVRPLVVLLDDLQWADDSSLSLLRTVAQHLNQIPVLLLGTYRNVELDVQRPLSRALDELLRHRLASRINLKRHDEDGVRALLSRMSGQEPPPGLVRAIYEETDGNSFFVEEVFRHLSEHNRLFDGKGAWLGDLAIGEIEVPESVRLVIGRRLEGLKDPSRKTLSAAAIIGRTFDFELLENVTEVTAEELLDAIEEAQRLSLIEPLSENPSETRYQFGHELIRQTLLSGMALPRRQRLHLRVAEAAENLYADTLKERAPEIVNHLFRAGSADPQTTLRLVLLAGERAQDSAAFDEALRYYEQALELLGDEESKESARALLGLGQAQRSLGRHDEALTSWRRALAISEARGDFSAMAEVAHEMVLQLGWEGEWAQVLEIAGLVLGRLGPEPTPERTLLLAFMAVGLGWAGDYQNSTPLVEEALQLAHGLGDKQLLGQVITVKSTHEYAYGFLSKSIDTGLEAMDLLRGTRGQWNYVTALAFVAIGLAFLCRLDEAEPYIEELEEMSTEIGFAGGLLFANRARFWTSVSRDGDLARYEALALRDLELCEQSDSPWIGQSYVFLARAKLVKGDVEGAVADLNKGREKEVPGVLAGFAVASLFWTLAHLPERREEAMGLWDEVTELFPDPDSPNPFGRWNALAYVVEGLFLLGEFERAAGLYGLLGRISDTEILWRWDGRSVEALLGLAAAAGGNWEVAHAHFQRGLKLADDLGLRVERLDSTRLYAIALLATGAPSERERAREM